MIDANTLSCGLILRVPAVYTFRPHCMQEVVGLNPIGSVYPILPNPRPSLPDVFVRHVYT
jgi:hypothetical protein